MSDRVDLKDMIANAANAIVNARDFCGDEVSAAKDSIADDGWSCTPDILFAAQAEANEIWRQSQKSAGVKSKYIR